MVSGGESLQQSTDAAIVVDGVGKTFANGTRALGPVTLRIRQGEFVAVVGPSGCGKSTLLRLIAGLAEPSTGSVSLARALRDAGIGYVFQSPTLMPWASVERNVRLPLDLDGVPREQAADQVEHALAMVGLREFGQAYPRELSGGMQMRVSIARALVTRPRLLLMDEPFGALDEITRNRLDLDLSALCARENLTVMFVTHSIYEAAFLSSRVIVMSARPGRIAGDFAIEEPRARSDGYRHTPAFARINAQLSAALAAAMDEPEFVKAQVFS
ncbi:MAG TPA: ABC transporter ATP-binding protein [Burkholderiales bacterium]|nr:ABC transporter ATP-binding protein [Burkholderiales bacterium]